MLASISFCVPIDIANKVAEDTHTKLSNTAHKKISKSGIWLFFLESLSCMMISRQLQLQLVVPQPLLWAFLTP